MYLCSVVDDQYLITETKFNNLNLIKMKTKSFYLLTKATVVVVLVAVLAAKAFAGSSPKVSLVPYAPERAMISVENLSNSPSEVAIEDFYGNVVYYKERAVNKDFYSKMFDFKNLRDGDYKIIVKNNSGEYTLPFSVVDRKVEVAKNSFDVAPYVEVKEGVLKVSMLNHNMEDVRLNFLSENGVIYSKKLGNEFSITAGFNLGRLENGEYAVEIKSGNKTFSYNFAK
jgi:hypothetical protein